MTEELKQKGIKYACDYPSSQDLGYKRLGYKRVDLRKAYIAGATENGIKRHKLSEKYPEAGKLIRVHCHSGMEYICETCYYEPTEDEIGYGKLVINFYELNGEWVDDTDVVAWCETPQFKE